MATGPYVRDTPPLRGQPEVPSSGAFLKRTLRFPEGVGEHVLSPGIQKLLQDFAQDAINSGSHVRTAECHLALSETLAREEERQCSFLTPCTKAWCFNVFDGGLPYAELEKAYIPQNNLDFNWAKRTGCKSQLSSENKLLCNT